MIPLLLRLLQNAKIRQLPPARHRKMARLAVFVAATSLGLVWGAQEKPAAPAPAQAEQANKPAEYVGSDTCQMCHEDIFKAFQKNPHQIVGTEKKRGWEGRACESCHGPGSKHAESTSPADIINPAKVRPQETDKICLKCHLNQPTNIGRIYSSHVKNQVSCVSCHSIHKHGPLGLVPQRRFEVNALCSNCHIDVWASFQKPYKHRLPDGAMSCVDCHNPHGSFLPGMVQTAFGNELGCFKCHGDKRGPFVFEHPPTKVLASTGAVGCGACHEPHGSANPRMLTRAQVRFVCLECHANLPAPTPPANGTLGTVPPALHDLRSPRFQNCTICHQKVHGSYVDRDLFK